MAIKHYIYINVSGVNLPCEECYGYEYDDHEIDHVCVISKYSGFPFSPFRYEKIIDEFHAYIVDNEGIIWIFEPSDSKETGFKNVFSRPCLYFCLGYILRNDKDMNGLKYSEIMSIIGVNDIRASIYDKEQEEMEKFKNLRHNKSDNLNSIEEESNVELIKCCYCGDEIEYGEGEQVDDERYMCLNRLCIYQHEKETKK